MWRRTLVVLFLGYAAIWTTLLVVPDISRILFIPSDLPKEIAKSGWPVDKVVHASGYSLLTALAIAAIGRGPQAVPLIWLGAGGALHGVATEMVQFFIPERSADILDWCADTLGVTAAILITLAFRRLKLREPKLQTEV